MHCFSRSPNYFSYFTHYPHVPEGKEGHILKGCAIIFDGCKLVIKGREHFTFAPPTPHPPRIFFMCIIDIQLS